MPDSLVESRRNERVAWNRYLTAIAVRHDVEDARAAWDEAIASRRLVEPKGD